MSQSTVPAEHAHHGSIEPCCGIAREQLSRNQEPFFTTKEDGHGLGLAICRSIVAEMLGHLRIESTPGTGTLGRASFPIKEGGDS